MAAYIGVSFTWHGLNPFSVGVVQAVLYNSRRAGIAIMEQNKPATAYRNKTDTCSMKHHLNLTAVLSVAALLAVGAVPANAALSLPALDAQPETLSISEIVGDPAGLDYDFSPFGKLTRSDYMFASKHLLETHTHRISPLPTEGGYCPPSSGTTTGDPSEGIGGNAIPTVAVPEPSYALAGCVALLFAAAALLRRRKAAI